jgi:TctA family transporter
MLTLGIPSNPVMALMIGAMIIHGITPGPNVVTDEPALFWGLIASMVLTSSSSFSPPASVLGPADAVPTCYPAILVFCDRVFSLNNRSSAALIVFGLLGYVFAKLECETAPMLLGFILGPLMEEYLRRAMLLSRGDPMVLVQRPISATILVVAALALLVVLSPAIRRTRDEAFQEG